MAWASNKRMNYLALFEITTSCYTPKCRELNVLEHRTQGILQTFEERNLYGCKLTLKLATIFSNYVRIDQFSKIKGNLSQ